MIDAELCEPYGGGESGGASADDHDVGTAVGGLVHGSSCRCAVGCLPGFWFRARRCRGRSASLPSARSERQPGVERVRLARRTAVERWRVAAESTVADPIPTPVTRRPIAQSRTQWLP